MINNIKEALEETLKGYVGEEVDTRNDIEPKKRRPKGYWEDFENVKREYLELTRELKHPPTTGELKDLNRGDLVAAMVTHYDGICAVRNRLKLIGRKPQNYWNDFNNVKTELEEIISKIHHFPKREELKDMGKVALLGGIAKQGGMRKVRTKMNYTNPIKPSHYWNKRTIIKEAKIVIERFGYLLTETEMESEGYSGLSHAITDNMGFQELREELGLEQHYTKRGTWQDKEYLKEYAQKIMQDHGFDELPGSPVLKKLGYTKFVSAVNTYFKGFDRFRKFLGQYELAKKWQNLEYVIKEAKEIKKRHKLNSLPSSEKLCKMGYSGLAAGIQRYHGYDVVRDALGEKHQEKRGKWKDTNVALEEAVKIMDKYNLSEFPTGAFLQKNGYISFLAGIVRYQGGLKLFKDLVEKHIKGKSSLEQLENLLEDYTGDS